MARRGKFRRSGGEAQIDRFVGSRIRARRLQFGLSQTELAARVGVTYQQQQKYENGATRISASRLWHLCRELDSEMSYFFPESNGAQRTAPEEAASHSARETLELMKSYGRIRSSQMRRKVRQLAAILADKS